MKPRAPALTCTAMRNSLPTSAAPITSKSWCVLRRRLDTFVETGSDVVLIPPGLMAKLSTPTVALESPRSTPSASKDMPPAGCAATGMKILISPMLTPLPLPPVLEGLVSEPSEFRSLPMSSSTSSAAADSACVIELGSRAQAFSSMSMRSLGGGASNGESS